MRILFREVLKMDKDEEFLEEEEKRCILIRTKAYAVGMVLSSFNSIIDLLEEDDCEIKPLIKQVGDILDKRMDHLMEKLNTINSIQKEKGIPM